MKNKILAVGLLLVPFLTLASMKNWDGKLFTASIVCLAVFVASLRDLALMGQPNILFRRKEHWWLLVFLGIIFIQPHFIPKYTFNILGGVFTNPWMWKCFFNILCFALLYLAISTVRFDKSLMIKCMMWSGTVMAIYIILQSLGIDQFWSRNLGHWEAFSLRDRAPWAYGSLGNSRIAGAFLALTFPFTLMCFGLECKSMWEFLRKMVPIGLHITAVILTESRCAMMGFGVGTAFLCVCHKRKYLGLTFLGIIAVIIGYYMFGGTDSGRLAEWSKMFEVFKFPREQFGGRQYCFFGHGMGSIPYAYSGPMKSPFTRAHNEYLEILFSTGIFGLTAFTMTVFYFLKRVVPIHEDSIEDRALFSSVAVGMVMAFWVFVWQIGPLALYQVVAIGLLSRRSALIPVTPTAETDP